MGSDASTAKCRVPAPLLLGGGLDDRASVVLRFRHDLVEAPLGADQEVEQEAANPELSGAPAGVGGQAVAAVEPCDRPAPRNEGYRESKVLLDFPAKALVDAA
jgi:hypothetical protein